MHEIIAYTGELTVRYHDRVPIGVPLTLRSGIADRSGRSTTMWATATVDRRVVATGHGVFVEGPPDEVDRVRRDVLDRGSTR